MGWDEYARSKMPLKLVLILMVAVAVNFGLVLGFQALVTYHFDSPIDDITVLGDMDSAYEGCTLIDIAFADPNFYGTYGPHLNHGEVVFLVETQAGDMELVTVRKHFLFDRYRIVKSGCIKWESGTEHIRLRCGTTFLEVYADQKESTGQPDIYINGVTGHSANTQFRNSMFLSIAALCAVELAAYCLLFKREEIL